MVGAVADNVASTLLPGVQKLRTSRRCSKRGGNSNLTAYTGSLRRGAVFNLDAASLVLRDRGVTSAKKSTPACGLEPRPPIAFLLPLDRRSQSSGVPKSLGLGYGELYKPVNI